MQVETNQVKRRVTITLTRDEHDRLCRCAAFRRVTPGEAVAACLSDRIEVDHATAEGKLSRRMIYRDDPYPIGTGNRR